MGRILCVANQKGGVGKTTLSLNLGLAFSQLGIQTTIIEADPQGSLGSSSLQSESFSPGLAEILRNDIPLSQAQVNSKAAGLSLLPLGDIDPGDVLEFEQNVILSDLIKRIINESLTC